MPPDTLEDVDQIRVDVDAVEPASDDQALHDADLFGTQLGPTEIPIFSAHRDSAQGALEMVGIQWHVGVGEEYFQAQPPFPDVVECLCKGVVGRSPCSSRRRSTQAKKASTCGLLCVNRCSFLTSPVRSSRRISSSTA